MRSSIVRLHIIVYVIALTACGKKPVPSADNSAPYQHFYNTVVEDVLNPEKTSDEVKDEYCRLLDTLYLYATDGDEQARTMAKAQTLRLLSLTMENPAYTLEDRLFVYDTHYSRIMEILDCWHVTGPSYSQDSIEYYVLDQSLVNNIQGEMYNVNIKVYLKTGAQFEKSYVKLTFPSDCEEVNFIVFSDDVHISSVDQSCCFTQKNSPSVETAADGSTILYFGFDFVEQMFDHPVIICNYTSSNPKVHENNHSISFAAGLSSFQQRLQIIQSAK